MVEAIVQRPAVIDRLRTAFPTAPGLRSRPPKIRRVCNGTAVLEAAVGRPDDLRALGVLAGQITARSSCRRRSTRSPTCMSPRLSSAW